jgi:hypothetical protein
MELYRVEVMETCRLESCMQELDMVMEEKFGKLEEKEDCMLGERESGKMELQVGCKLVGKEDCKQVGKEDCKQVGKEDCKLMQNPCRKL